MSLRRADGDPVTLLRASRSGRLVAVGTAHGVVTVFESSHWRVLHTVRMQGTLRLGAFSYDDHMLALVSEPRELRLFFLEQDSPDKSREFSLEARDISFSPDDRALSIICSDGSTWFYSVGYDRWKYMRDHHALAAFGRFSSDGRWFVSSDVNGQVVVREVPAAF